MRPAHKRCGRILRKTGIWLAKPSPKSSRNRFTGRVIILGPAPSGGHRGDPGLRCGAGRGPQTSTQWPLADLWCRFDFEAASGGQHAFPS